MRPFSAIGIFASLLLPFSMSAASDQRDEAYKILHVMSYHQTWEWNQQQFRGFKDGLGDLSVSFKVIELDTKRISDEGKIQKRAQQAHDLVKSWQPDLLYTNDDNAQKYVATRYISTNLPIVFSGVNRDPSEYGFLSAKNVTGVMEYEHFVPTLNYLRTLEPNIKRLAVIINPGLTWKGVASRIRSQIKNIPDIDVTEWILVEEQEEFQNAILHLQDKVDAIAMLGVFNIKDKEGNNLDYTEVLKWTQQNSQLPDFSFWETRVERGTLCAVAVSGYEQGLIAGKMARDILKNKKDPASISISSTTKGQPMINLKRAKDLGIRVDVNTLLESKVYERYSWDL